jgi:hypothetical protein
MTNVSAVSVNAQFSAVPGVFTTTSYVDRVTADVAAGFDIVARSGASIRLEYDGRFSENATQSSFLAKAALPF